MNPRTTAMLALLAGLLGAFVYFYEIEGESGREAAREEEKRLFASLEPGAIDALELTTSDGVAARFARREGAWWLLSPVEARADAAALEAIASALAELPRAGAVEAAADDRAQFGLGADGQAVQFAAGASRHALRIGRATPVGGQVYVERDGDAGVAYVESYRLNALKRSLTELRDRRVAGPGLDGESLARLELRWPEAGSPFELVLEREAGRDWQIVKPLAARADPQVVRELVSNLEFLEATGFVDARTAEVERALAETELSIVWRGAEAETAQDAPEPGGTLRFAGVEGESRLVEGAGGTLYRVAPERLDDFARRLAAYRDKQLIEVDAAQIEKVEFVLPPAVASEDGAALQSVSPVTIVLVRGAEGFAAEGRMLEAPAVDALVESLASLRAEELVADEMGEAELASLGLLPPRATIGLALASEAKQAAGSASGTGAGLGVELGKLDSERGLFVRRIGEPAVYVLSGASAEALPLDAPAFVARFEQGGPETGDDAASGAGDAASPGADLLE